MENSSSYEDRRRREVHEQLGRYQVNQILSLKTDRGNGSIENLIRWEGFGEDGQPQIRFVGGALLDIRLIGGYKHIVSIREECPDGASVLH